jgi:hypothetical protein
MIKKYRSFLESKESIDDICQKYGIENYTIKSDGTVDVDWSVHLRNYHLDKLPLKFGVVTRDFICAHNNLTSLEGCPTKVGWNFDCNNNELTSLEHGPVHVGGSMYKMVGNKIASFEGFPTKCRKGLYTFTKDNPIHEIRDYLNVLQGADIINSLNEWEVIDPDEMTVSYSRLSEVYKDMGRWENIIPKPEDIKFKNYTLTD